MRLSHDVPAPQTVRCAIAARAGVAVPAEALPALRQKPHAAPAAPPPASLLRHADEQTVVGLVAVYQALRAGGLDAAGMADWGVVAAPELLGRTAMAPVLKCYAEEGAWGISPHHIPHRSLHSVSGTISLALGLRGPNFGAGGGPGAAADGFLTAAALLTEGHLPGLWLVLTGGAAAAAGLVWQAAALALVPDPSAGAGLALQTGVGLPPASWPGFTLEGLLAVLDRPGELPRARWRLDGGAWVELQAVGAAVGGRP